MNEIKDKFSKDDFKNIILSDNTEIRKQFQDAFPTEINDFIETIFNAYEAQKMLDKGCGNDERKKFTSLFLFNAISNLVDSFTLLISGYMISSGNLMRHFAESLSMALLISNKSLNYFEKLEENVKKRRKFPVHKSLGWVLKHRDKLGINCEMWNKFIDLEKSYDDYSHASLFSLSRVFHFALSGSFSMRPDYDSEKQGIYKEEVTGRINMANFLKSVISYIDKNLY